MLISMIAELLRLTDSGFPIATLDSCSGHWPAPTATAVAFSTASRERERQGVMAETSTRSFPALTPEEERLKIRDISLAAESQSKEGDTFYLITQRWWQNWLDYVNQEQANVGNDASLHSLDSVGASTLRRPSSIDNKNLIYDSAPKDCTDAELHDTLVEGRDYVLLPEEVWNQLYSWYGGGPTLARKVINSGLSQMELAVEIRIYDFYGRKKHALPNDMDKTLDDANIQMDQEILVEVLNNTTTSVMTNEPAGKQSNSFLLEPSKSGLSIAGGLSATKGVSKNSNPELFQSQNLASPSRESNNVQEISGVTTRGATAGLTGLLNLGNTCYMNSAIQCLVHTPEFARYFREDYRCEINRQNPMGMVNPIVHGTLPLEVSIPSSKYPTGVIAAYYLTSRAKPSRAKPSQARVHPYTQFWTIWLECYKNFKDASPSHSCEMASFVAINEQYHRPRERGVEGELALAFGELLRKLWAPGRTPVAPRPFKAKLSRFAPQFSGYNQHDSQELLAFLLDGLHEDLNRVKDKPYVQSKDADGRPDEEVADEYWANHKARNDSIIVDVCQVDSLHNEFLLLLPQHLQPPLQMPAVLAGSAIVSFCLCRICSSNISQKEGQYKSTLVCPVCAKVSVTFDPFMYLSLPLQSTATRTLTLTIFSSDGGMLPNVCTVTVPKQGRCRDLIQALSAACSLKPSEKLLLAEIQNHLIHRFFEDPLISLSCIKDDDHLAAYRIPSLAKGAIFLQETVDFQSAKGWKPYGTPLVSPISCDDVTARGDVQSIVRTMLSPMLKTESQERTDASADDISSTVLPSSDTTIEHADSCASLTVKSGNNAETCGLLKLPLHLVDENNVCIDLTVGEEKTINISPSSTSLLVFINWSKKLLEKYDTSCLENLPEVCRNGPPPAKKARTESLSLYNCLEAFLREEPLVSEPDMWKCPQCEERRQASKKLDLWRLPKVLVIHLKRFSYNRSIKHKLDTHVNFPIHDLDLTKYIANKNNSEPQLYELYALINHYGSMGNPDPDQNPSPCDSDSLKTRWLLDENRWYNFDDSHIVAISEEDVKTNAAYVLFYRRKKDNISESDRPLSSISDARR
ncbi:hypothetical protein Cgig2_022190 [Carnegiea gigantea]|uniref:Ubiquitinyl hydrolase 1 n=1 Tax=Carnegiea gigantea TaxID=171969 RepID=A0A9Q1JNA4_9CARY|nr:hypothetical protein Cgig2_022190 [Carnegiea gigantea]